jgi:hypothetical protein
VVETDVHPDLPPPVEGKLAVQHQLVALHLLVHMLVVAEAGAELYLHELELEEAWLA